MSLNHITLIGRLTKDPELSYTPQGVAVARFTLAVDRNTKPNAQGEKETDFIPCIAWRHSAEFAANYLGKGRLVAVEGRLQIRKWTPQDGNTKYFTEVVCERVQGLDKPRQEGQDAQGGAAAQEPDPWGMDNSDPFGEQ